MERRNQKERVAVESWSHSTREKIYFSAGDNAVKDSSENIMVVQSQRV